MRNNEAGSPANLLIRVARSEVMITGGVSISISSLGVINQQRTPDDAIQLYMQWLNRPNKSGFHMRASSKKKLASHVIAHLINQTSTERPSVYLSDSERNKYDALDYIAKLIFHNCTLLMGDSMKSLQKAGVDIKKLVTLALDNMEMELQPVAGIESFIRNLIETNVITKQNLVELLALRVDSTAYNKNSIEALLLSGADPDVDVDFSTETTAKTVREYVNHPSSGFRKSNKGVQLAHLFPSHPTVGSASGSSKPSLFGSRCQGGGSSKAGGAAPPPPKPRK